jgi:hypothetical protein
MDIKKLLPFFFLTWAALAEEPAPVATSTETVVSSVTLVSRPWRVAPAHALTVPESCEFVIKWGLVTAGYSTLSIAGLEVVNGRSAYHLVSEAHSTGVVDTFYKVRDRNESWLDQESLTSVRYTRDIREGSYRLEETIVLDQVQGVWTRDTNRIDKNRRETKSGELPLYALDVQSSLYYVRTLPLEAGQTFTLDVQSGDKSYPLVVKVKKRETIKTPAGKFDTFLVEPLLRGPGMFVSKGKKLEVWMTADERRMPVRMRSEVFFGHVTADLIKYQ